MRNCRQDREPVGVIDVLEAQLLEHVSWLVVGINNTGGDVFANLSEALWHDFDDQRAETATLEALVDLQAPKASHLNSKAPGDEVILLLCECTDVQVHLDQPLDEVQRAIVCMRPQIVDFKAIIRNQLLQVDSLRCTNWINWIKNCF